MRRGFVRDLMTGLPEDDGCGIVAIIMLLFLVAVVFATLMIRHNMM